VNSGVIPPRTSEPRRSRDEFFVDLLLFHVEQLRYVVVELKIGKFRHDYVGALGFYVTMVDDQLRRPDRHAPTVGILLCTSRNDQVVRYALRSTAAAVSTFTYDTLPPAEQAALPAAATLAAAISRQGSVKADAPVTGSDKHGGHPPIPIMINRHRYRLFAVVPEDGKRRRLGWGVSVKCRISSARLISGNPRSLLQLLI
jgi:hypothetical protein